MLKLFTYNSIPSLQSISRTQIYFTQLSKPVLIKTSLKQAISLKLQNSVVKVQNVLKTKNYWPITQFIVIFCSIQNSSFDTFLTSSLT